MLSFSPILSTLGSVGFALIDWAISNCAKLTACFHQNKPFAAELTSIHPVGEGSPLGIATVSTSKSN
jgi:hypothetical protein